MLEILREILVPLLHGGDAGCRIRIKPSWSGRVYGTYNLRGRHLVLAIACVVSWSALLEHLLLLNIREPSPRNEIAALQRNAAQLSAMRLVEYPRRARGLEKRTEGLKQDARLIESVLGLHEVEVAGGRGGMDHDDPLGDPQLNRIDAETGYLRARYARLATEFRDRYAELIHTPSVVPVFDAEFFPTSPFGRRISPFTRLVEQHRGMDLAAEMFTKIVATADGVVSFVERDPRRNGMGLYLVIDHGGRFESWYGHCATILVEIGQVVKRHQVIAEVGSTGRSTGPHVHYEIRRDGKAVDPSDFMLLDPRFAELHLD